MNESKNVNEHTMSTGTVILIVLLILTLLGLIGGIATHIITQSYGDNVQVRITDLANYKDYDHGNEHIVYGEVITEGDYKGEKIRFSTPFENNYKVGDVINGKYYNGNFIRTKE